jgi:hypothetical protein
MIRDSKNVSGGQLLFFSIFAMFRVARRVGGSSV